MKQMQRLVRKPQKKLLEDFQECADGIRVTGPHIIDVREKTLLGSDNRTTHAIRRVYIQVHDSGRLRSVGWIVDDSSELCPLCQIMFSPVNWKHHCRVCGLIICASCSPNRRKLEGFDTLAQQRVCNNCIREVTLSFHDFITVIDIYKLNRVFHDFTAAQKSPILLPEDNSDWGTSVLGALRSNAAAAAEASVAAHTSQGPVHPTPAPTLVTANGKSNIIHYPGHYHIS